MDKIYKQNKTQSINWGWDDNDGIPGCSIWIFGDDKSAENDLGCLFSIKD